MPQQGAKGNHSRTSQHQTHFSAEHGQLKQLNSEWMLNASYAEAD